MENEMVGGRAGGGGAGGKPVVTVQVREDELSKPDSGSGEEEGKAVTDLKQQHGQDSEMSLKTEEVYGEEND